jgi:signal peptidase
MFKGEIGGKRIGNFLFVALTGLIILLSLSPLFGLRFDPVLSRSMSPALRTGDLVIVTSTSPKDLSVGEVIVFKSQVGGVLVCHLIVAPDAEEGLEFQTKGDANEVPDGVFVEPEDIMGKVQASVPMAGYIVQWLRGPFGILAIVALAAAALLIPDSEQKECEKETAKEDVNAGS